STATLWPPRRTSSISLPVRLLLPTPPGPVTATTRGGSRGAGSPASPASTCPPRATRLTRLASARPSPARNRSRSGASMPVPAGLPKEGDDLVQGRPRAEDAGDAHLQEARHVVLGDDAAHQHADVPQPGLAQEFQDARHQGHVGAGEQAEAEPVGVLVGAGADDGLGGLPQAGVDDVQAGGAEGAGDDLEAAVGAGQPARGRPAAEGSLGCRQGCVPGGGGGEPGASATGGPLTLPALPAPSFYASPAGEHPGLSGGKKTGRAPRGRPAGPGEKPP